MFPEQDRCERDGELTGDITGEPFGDEEGEGYDATGDDGKVTCSDVRDCGTDKPLVFNMCNTLLG